MSNTAAKTRLTHAEFEKMAHAYTRLQELNEMAIKTQAHESEAKGIVEYLAETFINYAPEFLGVWTVTRNEYEPLVNALSRTLERVDNITFNRQAAAQAAARALVQAAVQTEKAEAPANITPLIQPS